jgi:hypothetical protein
VQLQVDKYAKYLTLVTNTSISNRVNIRPCFIVAINTINNKPTDNIGYEAVSLILGRVVERISDIYNMH